MDAKTSPIRFAGNDNTTAENGWSARYGAVHELRRVAEFPTGMRPLKRVRIYARGEHFIVQWWDPQVKKNLNERVNGDQVDAIARARQIETRLETFKRSGHGDRKLTHTALVDRYGADLRRRSDAGEISVSTVERYSTALEHYSAFVNEPAKQKAFPYAAGVNRDFQLALAAHLEQLSVAANGHQHARRRPLRSPQLVLDTVRAMYAWAADSARGNLLPIEFRNPFERAGRSHRSPAIDPFGEPDITIAMAVEMLGHCDAFQLPLFATLALFGLRAAEPVFLFWEDLDDGWLRVTCHKDLGYLTKGKRDKRFPTPPELRDILLPPGGRREGLLFTRRGAGLDLKHTPLFGASLSDLCREFERRCSLHATPSAAARQTIRDEIIRAAGGLSYDHIQHEFRRIAHRLGWPREATLKDLRHLFLTCLENSGVPEYYRRYLAGHAPGKAAIATYTHLDQLKIQFQRALDHDLAPLVAAVKRRAGGLDQRPIPAANQDSNEKV